jgi:holo-[acyl-carrier protein] synthase
MIIRLEPNSHAHDKPLFGVIPMIVGLGTDIIEIVRIGRVIERHGEQFLHRVFTAGEIGYCSKRREYLQHYAGRWAAKEAVMKVLGTGFAPGVGWRDIEICTRPSGQPFLLLHGGVKELAERLEIDEILISISHCRAYATATAIGLRK